MIQPLLLPESFDALPGDARLWLLALDRTPDTAARTRLSGGLAGILGQWRHKGQAYQGAGALLEPQLIAVAEPTLAHQPSGCAIDGMLRKVQRLLAELGLATLDPATAIIARSGDRLGAIPKAQIPERLADGTLDAGTFLLDLSLYCLADLRAGRLEAPLAETWVGRKYGVRRSPVAIG